MSKTNKHDKNQVSSSEFFNKNPDLFQVSPRPGGFLTLLVPTRSQGCLPLVNKKVSRNSSIVNEIDYCKYNDTIPMSVTTSPSKFSVKPPDAFSCPVKIQSKTASEYYPSSTSTSVSSKTETTEIHRLSMEMLGVTISCVMQIAANLDVSKETLEVAKTYLRCMKDENGNKPRNIFGILNEIRKLLQEKTSDVDVDGSQSSIGSSIFDNPTIPNSSNYALIQYSAIIAHSTVNQHSAIIQHSTKCYRFVSQPQ
ncbi:uncharacterized protein [Onthophagus taurus]|uniref:uncharacterized protein n=1 Tax=Onthophagus taurus TaxID=166361 RepID=UPI0039BE8B55